MPTDLEAVDTELELAPHRQAELTIGLDPPIGEDRDGSKISRKSHREPPRIGAAHSDVDRELTIHREDPSDRQIAIQ